MRRVWLLLLTLPVILTACLSGGSDEPRVTIEPTVSHFAPLTPTAAVTATTPPSPTATAARAPAASTPPPTAVEAVALATPTEGVCISSGPHAWPEIFIMSADGTNVRKIAPEGIIGAWDPAWSPDGTEIVFAGYDGFDDGIFIMNRDGTNVRRVTGGEGDSTEPAWSPDGTRIAFVSQHPDPGGIHLYVVDRDGSNLRQLTNLAGRVGAPDWSPDGTRIAFASDQDGDYEIYVIGADGEGLIQLTDRPTWDYAPIWSGNGQRITFGSGYFSAQTGAIDEDAIGAFTMNADGSDVRKIEGFEPEDSELRWSPGGGQVAFVRDFEIMVVDSAGGEARNLTQHQLADHWPRWSPDGQSILFVSMRNFWMPAMPGSGQPEAIVLQTGDSAQEGGFGSYCEPIENGFRSTHVLGVWVTQDPLVVAVGATLSFDFSAFPELSALEVVLYDYDEAQRIGKLPDGVITPPCAPPGGTESLCLLERIAGPADPPLLFDLPALKPGHYAVIVRANFGNGMQRGYTEQGFNLVVSG